MRSGDQPDCALGIISPAIWIGILFAVVMESGNLIFQSGAIMLIDDRRRHKNKQVAFVTFIVMALECVANYWNIAERWHLGSRLRHLSRNQTPDCPRVAPLDRRSGLAR